jgi:hypothetical protein
MSKKRSENAIPMNMWLQTKTPGLYVRSEYIEGGVWVTYDDHREIPGRRTNCWDSSWDAIGHAQVSLPEHDGMNILGLRIVPEEMESVQCNYFESSGSRRAYQA